MPVKTYDPKQVLVIVGGFPMAGFADGTFVTISRERDTFTKHVGADGEVSRAKMNDRSGTLELTLAQTSPSNDILSGIMLADESNNDGVVPVLVKDGSGRSVLFSAEGWVQKPADSEFGNEVGDRQWTIALANVNIFHGGNN